MYYLNFFIKKSKLHFHPSYTFLKLRLVPLFCIFFRFFPAMKWKKKEGKNNVIEKK